jgi:hypothetical protein
LKLRILANLVGFSLVVVSTIVVGCGSGSGSGDPTFVEGTVVDTKQQAVSDLGVFIYETYENSLTDEQGSFSISSYKHLSTLSLFFQQGDTNLNKVDIGHIPADALSVKVGLSYDRSKNIVAVSSVEFGTAPPPDGTPAPTDGTPAPGDTPTHSSPFDENGNTSGFGIPSGLSGNISAGQRTWGAKCAGCHAREKSGRSYGAIKSSFKTVPIMRGVSCSNQEIANLTAFLNRGRR